MSDNPFDQFVNTPAVTDDNPFSQFVASAAKPAEDNPFAQFVGKEAQPVEENHNFLSPDLPLGIIEGATTGALNAVGGAAAKGIGGILGAVAPGHTAAEDADKLAQSWQEKVGQHLAARSDSGKAVEEMMTKGLGAYDKYVRDPEKLGKLLSEIGITNIPTQGVISAGLTALPDVSTLLPLVGLNRAPKAAVRAVEAPKTSLSALDDFIAQEKLKQASKVEAELGIEPMEAMAKDLGAPPEAAAQAAGDVANARTRDEAAAVPPSAMSDMANVLENKNEMRAKSIEELLQEQEAAHAQSAQDVINARQAALEQDVARQTSLDNNAAQRARQENAPGLAREPVTDLFPRAEVGGPVVRPAEAGAGPLPPERGVMATEGGKRQMGFDFGKEEAPVRQVAPEGTVFPPEQLDANAVLGRERATEMYQPHLEEGTATLPQEQRDFNTRTRKQGGGVLMDFGRKKARTEQLESLIDQLVKRHVNGEISMDQYREATAPLHEELSRSKLSDRKVLESAPAKVVKEVHPGYGKIPDGTRIQTDYGVGVVSHSVPIRFGEEVTMMPKVDYGDGRLRSARPDQIQKVFGKPQSFNERTRGQGGAAYFGEQVRKAQDESPVRWFHGNEENGMSKTRSLQQQAQRPNANSERFGPGHYVAQSRDFSSVYGGPKGRMYEVEQPFQRPFDTTKPGNEKLYDTIAEKLGSRAEANKFLQKQGYDGITFSSPRGDKLGVMFDEKPMKDIGPAREKIRQQTLTLESYEPGSKNDPLRSQRGMVKIGEPAEKAVKGIGAFQKWAKNLAPDRSTPAEFIAEHGNGRTPDVQQSFLKQAANLFTKGSIYMQERLSNNPLYKRVTDRFREADNLAKAQQQSIVHDIYAPSWRGLSDAEKARSWSALQKMQDAGVRVTGDQLVDMGFNQKERDAIATHFNVMDKVLPKINEAMDAAGLSHIKPEAAFVASKMTGTFRKTMLDANNDPIGFLGDRTRSGLLKQEAAFKKLYPEAVSGKEQVMSGRQSNSSSMADLLSYLSENDPHMAAYLKASKEAGAADALNFRGAKTHTMMKKGVVGMEGNRPWESDFTNAQEGIDAQIKYLNRVLEFAEKAKAEADVRPLLDSPELNMPNAKQLASDYRDYSLGKNPYKFAKISDAIGDFFDSAAGGKLSYAGDIARGTKKLINTTLLSANPLFLEANILQPLRNMPEIASFLGAKGAAKAELQGPVSMGKVTAQLAANKLDPLLTEARQYAQDNHVYASDLVEQRTASGRFGTGETLGQKFTNSMDAIDHALQTPASKVESVTRQTFFLTMVDMLHENGIKKSDGLFDIAANLTDRGMNRYSMDEAPILIKAMGGMGKYPYNLMSFKFNELSRLMSIARQANPMQINTMRPLLTAMSMQVAIAGLMGTVGFPEANWVVSEISELLGSPTSLTKILLDHGDDHIVGPVTVKDVAYGGLSKVTGIDQTNRMGVGSVVGDLGSPANMAFPGLSKLTTGIKDIGDFAKDPSKYNAAKAAVDILPGGALLDRWLFSKGLGTDKEMGFNRNRVESGVERNTADKIAKTFGGTGVNEASKKTSLYENQRVDKIYQDKQKTIVDRMGQDLFMNGQIDPARFTQYTEAQGNLDSIDKQIENIAVEQNMPADKRDALKAAATQGLSGVGKMKRRFH